MNPRLKVCGVTDPAFAVEAARRGVSYLGLIFAAKSPRRVSVERAREIAGALTAEGSKPSFVGVFVERGKWRKVLRHPILFTGVLFERLSVGLVYLFAGLKRKEQS